MLNVSIDCRLPVCVADWRSFTVLTALVFMAAYFVMPAYGVPEEPIAIDTGPQFLHDDYLVDNYWVPGHSRAIVERHFHTPIHYEGNPILEGERFSYISVLRGEDGVFRMWYQLFNPRTVEPDPPPGLPRYGIAYAESDDGVNWELPTFGEHEWRGSKDNNVVWMGYDDRGAAGGFVIELPEKHSRGYKYAMLYQTHTGMHLVGSKDGIEWDRDSDVRLKHLHSDTFNAIAYDDQAERWFIFCRARNIYRNWIDDDDQGAVRRVAVMSSDDLWGTWADEPSTILVPDLIDTERGFTFFYGMPVRHYGGVFWGFLWPFQMNTVILAELAFSRDGVNWERPEKRPRLLEPGEEGSWDGGQVITTPHWIEVDDEWWIYYTGQDGPHGRPTTNTSSLGLLKMRKEGFVSRYGPSMGGRVCTRTITWPGGDLLVNAAANGNLRVRVVDPMRQPIDGFSYDECDVMAGDSVAHPIRWNGRSLDELAGKDVRIEFALRDAHLYTFRATGDRLDDARAAEMREKLQAVRPTASAPASRETATGDDAIPEMEHAERPEDTVASRDRPAVDVTQVMSAEAQPLIHFTFDDDAADVLPSQGAVSVSLQLGEKGKEQTTTPKRVADGDGGHALGFDGEDDLAFGQVQGTLPEAGVLQVRFRPDVDLDRSIPINKHLFNLFADTRHRDVIMVERHTGRLVYQAMRQDQETVTLRSQANFQAGQWYEVTVVFGPGGSRMYVDGELQDQWGGGFTWSSLRRPTLYLGSVPPSFGSGYTFPGAIGDVRVYDANPDGRADGQNGNGNAEASQEAVHRGRAMQGRSVTRGDGEATAAFRDGRLSQLRLGGYEFLSASHDEPLWVIELAEPDSETAVRVASDGSSADGFRVTARATNDRRDAVTAGRWDISDANRRRIATVEAWVARTNSGSLDFHFALDGLDGRYVVRKAWYPQMPLARLGEAAEDDYLLVPWSYGQIYRDVHAQPNRPWGRGNDDVLQAVHRTRYPSKFGNLQMQFYGNEEAGGGLLMMTPDAQRRIKDLVVDRTGDASSLRARFGHHLTADEAVRGRAELDYPVRLQWVSGDWYDAGRAYRSWAMEQSWARAELALGRRGDLPEWYAGMPSWVRIPADPRFTFEEKAQWPLGWVEAVGGPMGVHWYAWDAEGGPWNRAFPRYVEPHAQFGRFVEQYQSAGLKVMPYTNARLVDMDEPSVWADYEEAVVRNRSGDVRASERWPFYATRDQAEAARAAGKEARSPEWADGRLFEVMHEFAVAWLGADAWRETLLDRHRRLFLDHQVDAVYQDQLGVYAMFEHGSASANSDDAPGDPQAWQRHKDTLYGEIREDIQSHGKQPVLVSEYLNESQMPHIVGGLTVSELGDAMREPVPLWPTIYHTHFAAIGWQDDPSHLRDPKHYLHGRMVPLAWGSQLGWISYVMPQLPRDHPAIVEAYRQAVTLRRENPTTLGWGEMLRPPMLEDVAVLDVPQGGGDDRWPWQAILAGCFRDAEDGSRAMAVFSNWTDEEQTATAVIDTSAFDGRVVAERQDGTTLEAAAGDPLRIPLTLSAMSIEHLYIHEVQP
ncbi:DUF6259 domain-containing protein [Phycisphaerales bacterium AB-hyl4]|uniref:DUF6259 domain-containing protein n=1 Tax=Natronomicrosphaera hydrolytica TaxID=3242702 RepID=A0ABV4UA08_9BACT